MEKVKSIGFVAGLMLLILAAVMIYLSAKGLFSIPSANSYEDTGTHTFEPYQVLPVTVKTMAKCGAWTILGEYILCKLSNITYHQLALQQSS